MYEGALRRRELRLIMAGRMEPKDAPEIQSLFLGPPPPWAAPHHGRPHGAQRCSWDSVAFLRRKRL